jgi:hypothetical protein
LLPETRRPVRNRCPEGVDPSLLVPACNEK